MDADPLPDVVLEVDHTTDVRRRKLGIYKGSGFPEIWVLVPWEASVRAPGLAIHVRRRARRIGRKAASRASSRGGSRRRFTVALTEAPMSAPSEACAGTGLRLAMGAREGTKPEDDPFTRFRSA